MTNQSDYSTHVTIVAWMNIVFGAICGVFGLLAFTLLTGIGVASEDPQALTVLGLVGTIAIALMLAFSVPGLIAGYGLLKRRPWGKVAGIIVAVLGLMNFPIGTGVGIYALWVLSRDEAATYFESGDVSGDSMQPAGV